MGKLKPWLMFIEGDNGGTGGGSAEGSEGGADDTGGDNSGNDTDINSGGDDRGSGDDSDDDDDADGDDDGDWKKKSRLWEKRARNDQKRIKQLEKEQKDFQNSIATALGLKKGEDADPKQLAKDLSAKDEEISAMKLENSILRAAPSMGVDGDMLLDSRSFSNKVAELDADDKDFKKDLQALIREELKSRPNLALRGTSGGGVGEKGGSRKSGKETQGKGTGEQLTREDLKSMTPAEIEKARLDGRLKNLLGS